MTSARLVGLVLSLLVLSSLALAQPTRVDGWNLTLTAGPTFAGWYTSDDDDDEEGVGHALDHTTNDTWSWALGATMAHGDRDFLGLELLNPQSDGVDLEESPFTVDETAPSAKAVRAFVQLAGLFHPESSGPAQLLSWFRLDYRRYEFSGTGNTIETNLFVSRNHGTVTLDPGDLFRYAVVFEDWYLTLVRVGPAQNYFGLGVYRSELEKPHETMALVSGADLVVATRVESKGIFAGGSISSFDALARIGIVDFEAQSGEDLPVFGGDGSLAGSVDFRWRPEIELMGPPADRRFTRPRLSISPDFGFMFRFDYQNPAEGEPGSADGELSMDIILQAGMRAVVRF